MPLAALSVMAEAALRSMSAVDCASLVMVSDLTDVIVLEPVVALVVDEAVVETPVPVDVVAIDACLN